MFKDNAVGLFWEAVLPLTEKQWACIVTPIHDGSTHCHKSHTLQRSLQRRERWSKDIQMLKQKHPGHRWKTLVHLLSGSELRATSNLFFYWGARGEAMGWDVVAKGQREDGKKGISTTTKHKKQLWNRIVFSLCISNSGIIWDENATVILTVKFVYFIKINMVSIIFITCTKDVVVTCISRSQLFNLQKKVNPPANTTVLDAGKASNKTHFPWNAVKSVIR